MVIEVHRLRINEKRSEEPDMISGSQGYSRITSGSRMAGAIHMSHVDNEPDRLDIDKVIMEQDESFSATTFEPAPVPLYLLKTEKFDAIVSDYQMPGVNGIRFRIELRKKSCGSPSYRSPAGAWRRSVDEE